LGLHLVGMYKFMDEQKLKK